MNTTNSNKKTINDVFNMLNSWRHLPSYSLENRVTPYFAVFMREILCSRFGRICESLIPEFPLHIHTMYDEGERSKRGDLPKGSRHSYKVDYVAFSEDKTTAYLIELKTDNRYISKKQNEYLRRARDTKFREFVKAIKHIAKGSRKKKKYVHLLRLLANPELDLVNNDDYKQLEETSFSKVNQGFTAKVESLRINNQTYPKTVVVFIQPRLQNAKNLEDENGFKHIFFDEIVNLVKGKGELRDLFTTSLQRWNSNAGSEKPPVDTLS